MSELEVTTNDGVLRVTMNRPERLNALSDTMVEGISATLEGVAARGDVCVVVLTGAGGAFSAGADVGLGDPGDDRPAHERFDITAMDRANRMIRAVIACPVPVVAGVAGVAAGVGSGLALACDLQVCSASARFVLGFAAIGLMPDGGTSASLAASMGRARAMRTALLNEPLAASDAYTAGLVSHCMPEEAYEETLAGVVGRLAAGPPLAFAATKKAVNAAGLAGLEDALERERTGQAVLMRTADFAEGTRAFGEKRRARFSGE